MKNIKTTWDFGELFASDDDPKILELRKKITQEAERFVAKWKNRDDFLKNPNVLAEALTEYEQFKRNFYGDMSAEIYYFNLRSMQDQNDPKIKAAYNNAVEEGKKIENEMQFFELRISRIENGLHESFLNDPDLQSYRHYLERVWAWAPHLLSEPEEKLMNLKGSTSYDNWVRMTEGFLAKEEREMTVRDDGQKIKDNGLEKRKEGGKGFKKEKKTFYEVLAMTSDPDKKVRDQAGLAVNDILSKNVEIAEAEINSVLQDKKTNDMLRNLPRPDTARFLADDVAPEIVDTLITTVAKSFSVSERFYVLKGKLLRVPKLTYFDRVVQYGKVEKKYPFGEAVEIVDRVFSKLDPEFGEIFRTYLEKGLVDVYPRKNKGGGASCWHNMISQPGYVFLNHTDRLQDVLTIAHEFGHAINNELMRKKQNAVNFQTPLSTAEVASTFMEDFVLKELLKNADDELRLAIMMMKLDEDVGTIFRQTAGYRFETELHQEFRKVGYLAKEKIGELFVKNMSSYLGRGVDMPKGSENWWVHWSHFRYYFYIYSYVSGLLISKAMQNLVKEDPNFISKVKEFLSAGSSDSPKNIFSNMGIDITDVEFWEKGILEVESLLNETEILAKRLKKI